MRFPDKLEIYTSTFIPNDIGGYDKEYTLWGTVDGYIVPTKQELVLNEGRITLESITKAYTKWEIPDNIDFIICNGEKYKVVNQADYIRVRLLTIEKAE